MPLAPGRSAMPLAGLAVVLSMASGSDWFPCQGLYAGTPLGNFEEVPTDSDFVAALRALDVEAVRADMTKLLTDSNPCWPADFGNYVGLFSRVSWHASATFNVTDGTGGTGGGRLRFSPEASWGANTNMDKARALLVPLKQKYGDGLSWGDLLALVGTHAMWHQGTPITEFCFGRLDEADGNGSTPESPIPNAAATAKDLKDAFGVLGQDVRAAVALIGGGHAFGKAHGACSGEYQPAGLPPNEAREANVYPWVGKCPAIGNGTVGMGLSTWTTGFEGEWTSTPTRWSNEFFVDLLDEDWVEWTGPGGNKQWRPTTGKPVMRLSADLELKVDPEFRQWSELFARNITALGEAFDEAWQALMNNGDGWSSERRCVPLGAPPATSKNPDHMMNDDPSINEEDTVSSEAAPWKVVGFLVAAPVALAVHLVSTF